MFTSEVRAAAPHPDSPLQPSVFHLDNLPGSKRPQMSCLQTFPGHTQGPRQSAVGGGQADFQDLSASSAALLIHKRLSSCCGLKAPPQYLCFPGSTTKVMATARPPKDPFSLTYALSYVYTAHLQSTHIVPWFPSFGERERLKKRIRFSVG